MVKSGLESPAEVADEPAAMDVKGLGYIPLSKSVEDRRSEATRELKSGTATDRDPNGQTDQQEQNSDPQQTLTEEEILEAFERLKNMPAIKDSSLQAKLELVNDRYFVIICDETGKQIRRYPAQELAALPKEAGTQKGVLLNKAM